MPVKVNVNPFLHLWTNWSSSCRSRPNLIKLSFFDLIKIGMRYKVN